MFKKNSGFIRIWQKYQLLYVETYYICDNISLSSSYNAKCFSQTS